MEIRPAKKTDAKHMAEFIIMAEGELVNFLTGSSSSAEALTNLEKLITIEDSRYSWQVAHIALLNKQVAGAIWHFPASQQEKLDQPLINRLNQLGHSVNKLVTEGMPDSYYLSSMAINPEFRGQGIGTSLLNSIEKSAREKGFASLSLLVEEDNKKARKLYERQGFNAGKEVSIKNIKFLQMGKPLA